MQDFDYLKFIATIVFITMLLILLSLFFVYPWSFSLFKDEKISNIITMAIACVTLVMTLWDIDLFLQPI